MKKQFNVGDNVKVIFKDNNRRTVIIGKILKKGKKTLSLKFFKKVVYSLKKKVNSIVDFTSTVEKIKIKNKMKVILWPYEFNPSTQVWDDGGY